MQKFFFLQKKKGVNINQKHCLKKTVIFRHFWATNETIFRLSFSSSVMASFKPSENCCYIMHKQIKVKGQYIWKMKKVLGITQDWKWDFFFIIVLCIRYLILEMARRLASKLPFGTFSEAEISLVREEQGLLVGYISECIFTT